MKGSQRVPDRFVGFMTFSSGASAMSKFTESFRRVMIVFIDMLKDVLYLSHDSVMLDSIVGS